MNRIKREKQTIRKMIALYCRHHLKLDTVPEEYERLAEFACQRLSHCHFGEDKRSCKKCPVHCYPPQERQQIREIMHWAGPRMLFYAPKDTVIHIWHNLIS